MKKDFTTGYNPIGAANTENTTNIKSISSTGKRAYNKFDPREEAPEEYRFTARLPGELGRYLVEKAYQERTSIQKTLIKILEEDKLQHPEVMKRLEKEAKARK